MAAASASSVGISTRIWFMKVIGTVVTTSRTRDAHLGVAVGPVDGDLHAAPAQMTFECGSIQRGSDLDPTTEEGTSAFLSLPPQNQLIGPHASERLVVRL